MRLPWRMELGFAIRANPCWIPYQMLKSSRLLTNVQQFWMQTVMEGHRASTACYKYISVCLVSEIVILIRSYNVKQRAHREVRESEHTHGCVLRAVAEVIDTLADLIRSTSSEHCRPLYLRHEADARPGGIVLLNCRLGKR